MRAPFLSIQTEVDNLQLNFNFSVFVAALSSWQPRDNLKSVLQHFKAVKDDTALQ